MYPEGEEERENSENKKKQRIRNRGIETQSEFGGLEINSSTIKFNLSSLFSIIFLWILI